PHSIDTFNSAKLSWNWSDGTIHAGIRRLYADLLWARKSWPVMRDFARRYARMLPGAEQPAVIEFVRGNPEESSGKILRAYFNMTDARQPIPRDGDDPSVALFSSESARYIGARHSLEDVTWLLPYECVAFGPAEWSSATG